MGIMVVTDNNLKGNLTLTIIAKEKAVWFIPINRPIISLNESSNSMTTSFVHHSRNARIACFSCFIWCADFYARKVEGFLERFSSRNALPFQQLPINTDTQREDKNEQTHHTICVALNNANTIMPSPLRSRLLHVRRPTWEKNKTPYIARGRPLAEASFKKLSDYSHVRNGAWLAYTIQWL